MMDYAKVILAAMLLSGCEAPPREEWETAPLNYVCTTQQFSLVERQTEFCTKETGYLSTYCYGIAIMNNCTKKAATKGTR